MEWVSYVGFVAAFCTSMSFLPQAYKVIKTRDTRSISLVMYIVYVIGVSLWLIYGILTADIPLIVANFVTLLLAAFILFIKIKNRGTDKT
ncbi:MAG: SemiSWEET transporter [Prevotellaceae bacterium]|jgi:MtN3 and saliva related transmembrane protein|nr:SemiSWEET transporter [Prevotellaceae bacterium]